MPRVAYFPQALTKAASKAQHGRIGLGKVRAAQQLDYELLLVVAKVSVSPIVQ